MCLRRLKLPAQHFYIYLCVSWKRRTRNVRTPRTFLTFYPQTLFIIKGKKIRKTELLQEFFLIYIYLLTIILVDYYVETILLKYTSNTVFLLRKVMLCSISYRLYGASWEIVQRIREARPCQSNVALRLRNSKTINGLLNKSKELLKNLIFVIIMQPKRKACRRLF